MTEYELNRIEQHETRIQALERKVDELQSSLSSIKLMLFLIMAEVPIGIVVL